MVYKIKHTLKFDAGYTEYNFNVLSEHDGIRIWLTDWKHQIEGMKLKRWSHTGDDGSFVRRDQIEIPGEVIEKVKKKICDSIKVS